MDEAAKKAQERIDAEMAAADEKAAAAAQKAVEGEGGRLREALGTRGTTRGARRGYRPPGPSRLAP